MQNKHKKNVQLISHVQMQIKIRIEYYYTAMTMDKIKLSNNTKFQQGCGETESLIYYWWEYKMVQPFWKIFCQFLKTQT